MSDISKINPNNGMNVYDLKDSVCRTALTVNDPSEGSGVITFGVDADGNYGYKKVGADTVIPFKSGSEISEIVAGSKSILNYESHTSMSGFYQVSFNSNTDYLLETSITLTKGIWLIVLPLRYSNAVPILTIKNTTNESLNPFTYDTNSLIDYSEYLSAIYLYKVTNDFTFKKIRFDRYTNLIGRSSIAISAYQII